MKDVNSVKFQGIADCKPTPVAWLLSASLARASVKQRPAIVTARARAAGVLG
jgi:hypothetical protein